MAPLGTDVGRARWPAVTRRRLRGAAWWVRRSGTGGGAGGSSRVVTRGAGLGAGGVTAGSGASGVSGASGAPTTGAWRSDVVATARRVDPRDATKNTSAAAAASAHTA